MNTVRIWAYGFLNSDSLMAFKIWIIVHWVFVHRRIRVEALNFGVIKVPVHLEWRDSRLAPRPRYCWRIPEILPPWCPHPGKGLKVWTFVTNKQYFICYRTCETLFNKLYKLLIMEPNSLLSSEWFLGWNSPSHL